MKRWIKIPLVCLGAIVALFFISLFAQNTLNYWAQGGGAWYVGGTQTVLTGGSLTVNSGGTLTLASGSTVTASSDMKSGAGNGAIVANKATAIEYGNSYLHKTVLTLTLTGANDLDLADGDHGTGIKVYDFPAGYIKVIGVEADLSVVTNNVYNATANDVWLFSVGSTVAADDNSLSVLEADFIASQIIDTDSSTVLTRDVHAVNVVNFALDGTAAAVDLYVNAAIAAGCQTAPTTHAITGILTIYWLNLGDY